MATSRNAKARIVSSRPLPVPTSSQPHRRRNPEAARAVLSAAVDLLDQSRVGYRGLTMEAVAARAGVSKATLYRWWPDKAHLVLDAYRSKSARDVAGPISGMLSADLRSHLGQLAFALTNLGSARTVADIVLASLDDPNFGRLYRETLLRERREALLHVLTEARRRGQIRAGADLVVAVDTVFGAIHHRLLLTKDPIDGPFVTALCDLLLSGLTP